MISKGSTTTLHVIVIFKSNTHPIWFINYFNKPTCKICGQCPTLIQTHTHTHTHTQKPMAQDKNYNCALNQQLIYLIY